MGKRYAIVSKGMPLAQIQEECLRLGAKNIKLAKLSGQVFCELEEAAIERLKQAPGLAIKIIDSIKADQEEVLEVFASSQASYASQFYQFRELFTPPITGAGLVVAVLDSGIRKTHRSLRGKVTYEENFSDSDSVDDRFDHGTGIAYLIAGGRHVPGEESGIAPGARLMNIKVLGDNGIGTTESVILGMERVRELFDYAAYNLPYGDPMYPNAVSISWGAPDDGDPDNPLRLAIERLYGASPGKFPIFCAAGNEGPGASTIALPAASRYAWAVGAVTFIPFEVWQKSSRGPSLEGLTKPEMVFYGVDMLTASCKSDDAFVVKTGTSFASPLALGQLCLFREVAQRYGFLEQLLLMEYDQLALLVAFMSQKPPGSPVEKDNAYGYGMPMGDLMRRALEAPTPLPDLAGMMMPVLGLGMVGMLMTGTIKAIKR